MTTTSKTGLGALLTPNVFGIPTVLTTVLEERGGLLIEQLQDVFPDQQPLVVPGVDKGPVDHG